MTDFTPTQGRYLAFIHADTKGFGLPPAETEIAAAIGVAPPSVNQMMCYDWSFAAQYSKPVKIEP